MSSSVLATLAAVGRALGFARDGSESARLRGAVGEVLGAIGQLEAGTRPTQDMGVHLMWTSGLLERVRDGQGAISQPDRVELLGHLIRMNGSLRMHLPREPDAPPPADEAAADLGDLTATGSAGPA